VDGPWRLVGGLDIGFEDKTAFVLAAYSTKLRELRHVWDFSKAHMVVDDVADMLARVFERFGSVEKIFVDTGNLGKMVVQSLMRRGFPLEAAEKREKNDFIELLNSAFSRGEVKIVESATCEGLGWESALEEQLLSNAWDLSKGTREELARQGRLREDDSIPNDNTDALLYLFRGSLHQFGMAPAPSGPAPGTPEWRLQWEKQQLAAARTHQSSDRALGGMPRPPTFVRNALQRDQWLPTPGRFKSF
jgi:hypothetical protein